MSPVLHAGLFAAAGAPHHTYALHPLAPDALADGVSALLSTATGFNVTVPHKQAIIPFLDRLDASAARYGAVNTVHITDGGAVGYNTDGIGFLYALREAGVALTGRVGVLGCGGAARVFVCEAAAAGCEVVNIVRTASIGKAEALRDFVTTTVADVPYTVTDTAAGHFDLLINATPVGMFPHVDACPVSFDNITVSAVFDAVYNPQTTLFLQKAAAHGARAVGGLAMLVGQAAAAQTIWTGATFDDDTLRALTAAVRVTLTGRDHVILCGFMGSGKSTVGATLAKLTGLPLVDLDRYIEDTTGRSVSDIFAERGEAGFRAVERDALRAVTAGERCIIALGGGTVLDPDNRAVLRDVGRVFHLHVSLDETKRRLQHATDRPLINRPDRDAVIAALYAARAPIYKQAADVTIDGEQPPEQAAAKIMTYISAQR